MPFEREDTTATLIMIRMGGGKFRFSGLVRMTDSNGDTTIRITNQIITSIVFDAIEYIDPPSSNRDGDISMTHLSPDWAVQLS